MKQALILFCLSLLLMTACSSNNSLKTQYYLLNSPTQENYTGESHKSKPSVTVTLIDLPDYLNQASLVLQLSEHQLHYSHFHMWAEPLQMSVTEALTHDLNAIDDRYDFNPLSTLSQRSAATEVIVKISAFHATHQSQALLAGSYWLQDNSENKAVTLHHFKLTIALASDGYAHAVEQMRKAITLLARDITANLTTVPAITVR